MTDRRDGEYGYFNREHQYPCERCKGAGWTEARLMHSPREIYKIAEVLPDSPVPIEHQRCPDCQGSGGGKMKSEQSTAFAASKEKDRTASRKQRAGEDGQG